MKSPPNTYVIIALGIIGAFAVPLIQKYFENKNMPKIKAFILAFVLFIIVGIAGIFILETIFDL